MAALRSGAGLVKLAVPDVCLNTVAGFEACYMTVPLPNDGAGRIALTAKQTLEPLLAEADSVAVGPGLGRNDELTELVAWLYSTLSKPLVIDADGLFALAQCKKLLATSPIAPRIITPHAGEFARLMGQNASDENQRTGLAEQFANQSGTIVVLKGHGTVVTDGRQTFINPTGNPGMATGGTGDVLTGVIAALAGQGLSPLDAARLGVYAHGNAGDLAAADVGQVGLVASDLVGYLPLAFRG
jgi:NAD(P)H-hydrate epimerase